MMRSRLPQSFAAPLIPQRSTNAPGQSGHTFCDSRWHTNRAQQAGKVYRVGWFFSSVPLTEMTGPDPIDSVGRAFVRGLRELGYVEGQNLVLERRSAEGKFERIDEIATELVARKPDVIVTGGGEFLAQALQRVTKSVP
jgi:putative tryptophan/tyrosine transport system substrate-binding protein